MISRRPKPSVRSRAFTLAEMMLTLALVALMYTMVTTILVQIARYARTGREVAEQRLLFLKQVERLRYQLRSIHYPKGVPGLMGLRTSIAGRNTLRFYTAYGELHKGVVEVGYKIESYVDSKHPEKGERLGLFYREFPFRRQEMRTLDEFEEARWQLVLPDTDKFSLEYSASGQSWQKEWEDETPPRIIRVRIQRIPELRDRFHFDVTPGEGAGRWL